MNVILVVCSAFIWCAVKGEPDNQFNGGTPALIEDYPYFASIEFKGKYLCSGVVIDDMYVLSTNSCVGGLDVKKTYVRVGTNRLGHRGQIMKVTNITAYNNFLGTTLSEHLEATSKALSQLATGLKEGVHLGRDTADMAMLKVASAFTFNDQVTWANPGSTVISEQDTALLPLWSNTVKKGSRLWSAPVIVQSSADCTAAYNDVTAFNITNGMYCLSPKTTNSLPCLASPGTPLFYNEQVNGIVVYSPGCGSSLPVVVLEMVGHTTFLISTMCDLSSILG